MCKVLDGRLAFREIWNAREEGSVASKGVPQQVMVMANKGRAEAGKALEAARVADGRLLEVIGLSYLSLTLG